MSFPMERISAALGNSYKKFAIEQLENSYPPASCHRPNALASSELETCWQICVAQFLAHNQYNATLTEDQMDSLLTYLNSARTKHELVRLIDPARDAFSSESASRHISKFLNPAELETALLLDAWKRFLLAFSRSSRGLDSLHQFLNNSFSTAYRLSN